MSTNQRNRLRPGYTFNFSNYIVNRVILVDNDYVNYEMSSFISKINEKLYAYIQEINLRISGRILPFVQLRYGQKIDDAVRVIISDFDSTKTFDEYDPEKPYNISISNLSHLINFKEISPRRVIQICDQLIPGGACMLINEQDQITAAVDIFLDVAMFHSYAPLEQFTIAQKQKFSQNKFEFYRSNNFDSYYECDRNSPLSYWSLAFLAHQKSSVRDLPELDISEYIAYWDAFMKRFYPSVLQQPSIIRSPAEQIKAHVDFGNISNKYKNNATWDLIPRGDYLFCRINKDPDNDFRRDRIKDLFGITEFRIGPEKIIPITDYFQLGNMFQRELRELNISAFKVVNQL